MNMMQNVLVAMIAGVTDYDDEAPICAARSGKLLDRALVEAGRQR